MPCGFWRLYTCCFATFCVGFGFVGLVLFGFGGWVGVLMMVCCCLWLFAMLRRFVWLIVCICCSRVRVVCLGCLIVALDCGVVMVFVCWVVYCVGCECYSSCILVNSVG